MKITETQIHPIKPKDGLVAMASVVVDDMLYLGSIGVHARRDGTGYRITYPTRLLNGRGFHTYHPITKDAGKMIEEAVLMRACEVLNDPSEKRNEYARHSETKHS